MNWFTVIVSVIKILTILLEKSQRDQVVADTVAVERARVINEINKSLILAANIPAEVARLSDKELDEYVQAKGWYRD